MSAIGPFGHNPNWVYVQDDLDSSGNPNGTSTFYGYDDGDGSTTWYDPEGSQDCTTSTPSWGDRKWEVDLHDGSVRKVDD